MKENFGLTPQQILFCDYYLQTGNGTESYIKAGYKGKGNVAESSASRLLRNVKVIKYLEEENKRLRKPRIADMEEVKQYWSDLLRDQYAEHKDRLKASEYIAKTNAAFIEKKEIKATLIPQIVDDID